MESIRNESAGSVVLDLVLAINEKRAYLSEIDGLIGDGDHGINMSKGFTRAGERLKGDPGSLTHALATLGEVLFEGIGGSMGPLYGTFFNGMAETLGQRAVDAAAFGEMLAAAVTGLQEIGNAQVGDKTLIDALVPARDAFLAAQAAGKPLAVCLDEMAAAAEKGKESTRDLVAKLGRASRLGERSRGVLDAGATSCALILQTMASSLKAKLAADRPT